MELSLDLLNYSFFVILIGVCGAWIFLLSALCNSIRFSPLLDKFEKQDHGTPKVSVIIPARNEEKNIRKCLDSLIEQDYENYELVVIDDSSEDKTGKIISEYVQNNSKIIHVSARPKPEGWMGKNWACMEGYRKATGELLLFTDADTIHSQNVISLAVSNLLSNNLDALTVLPHLETKNVWAKASFQMMWCISHVLVSPIHVNNPSKKVGIFIGSFFLLGKKIYESIGTHEGVKSEILEDGALGQKGQKTKDLKYKIKMVRGEHLIHAVFGGDNSVWQGLNRIVTPAYIKNKKLAVGMFFTTFLLLLFPFLNLGYSAPFVLDSISFQLLFTVSLISSLLIFITAIVQAKKLFGLKIIYGFLAPIGSAILVIGILNGILQAQNSTEVTWKSCKKHSHCQFFIFNVCRSYYPV